MGIFNDLLTSSSTIDITDPIVAEDMTVVRELEAYRDKVDPLIPSAYGAQNEVQTVDANGASAGTFILDFVLANGESFSTAGIAFNASAATIESAIDTAASGVVTGWTNGDIAVTSAGNADVQPQTLTYSGASVANQNHTLVNVDGGGLTGGTPGSTAGTDGQPNRLGLGALSALGVITGTPPGHRDTPSKFQFSKGDLNAIENRPSQTLIKALIAEASFEEQVNYAENLFPILGYAL